MGGATSLGLHKQKALSGCDFVFSDEDNAGWAQCGVARGASHRSQGGFLLTCSQYLLGGRGWSQDCSHRRFPLLMFDVPSFWRNITICPFLGSLLIVLCSTGFCGRCWHLPVPPGSWDRSSRGLLVCFFCPRLRRSLCFSVLLVNFGLLFETHLRDHNRLFWGL